MAYDLILQGKVMWSFDHEVQEFTSAQKVMTGLTGIGGPLHNHNGLIALTDQELIIESNDDENLLIPLSSITQIYHGFDDVYTQHSVKNAGLFWQPLRLNFVGDNYQRVTIYLIIDYVLFYSHNQNWYVQLTAMLQ